MKRFLLVIFSLFTCSQSWGQVNFVKNPDLEDFIHCPTDWNQIDSARFWSNAIDSSFEYGAEYQNRCAGTNNYSGVPLTGYFKQEPHSGDGMLGADIFYDGLPPSPPAPLPLDYRDYLQGRLYRSLSAGRTYCVSFWVNTAERTGYVHNKIGAFLDNGTFDDTVKIPGSAMTFVTPQVYTLDVINDTVNWVKIEGSFVANGNETIITIGNFFKNSDVTYIPVTYWFGGGYSYYLFDDISVTDIDLPADAGSDAGVPVGSSVPIGRVGDITAKLLDCKWYHKGLLIDSGATINVHAASTPGIIDTYAVVQTICGNIKTDTVLVYTFSVGIHDPGTLQSFRVYPNPSTGQIYWNGPNVSTATIFDLSGRMIARYINPKNELRLSLQDGSYILELTDGESIKHRERITINE